MRVAPAYTPRMPKSGRPLSVRMTNCGPLGWMTDAGGYRYQPHHPETGAPWPPIPDILLAAWRDLADYPHAPEACLVNIYGPAARMGLHQDRDEADMAAPVVSLSLGDSLPVPDRRRAAHGSDPHAAAGLGRCRGAGRGRAARISWRRPDHPRQLDAVGGGRADQSHAAPRDSAP